MRTKQVCVLLSLVAISLGAFAAPETMRFAVIGDTRGGDLGVNEPILSELATVLISEAPELVLVSGDLVSSGTQAEFEHWVEVFMDPLLSAGIPVYPVRGNHDADIAAWNTVFAGTHALPDNGPPGEVNQTYSITRKNALFIGLDQSLVTHLYEANQPWLDDQLAANTRPHVFVFGHYPAFSVSHLDCMGTYPAARNEFWDSLAAAKVQIYFCGHDHFLDHARARTSSNGWIHQFLIGSGGAPMYDWNGTYYDNTIVPGTVEGFTHFKQYGYCIVDISGLDVHLTIKQRIAPGLYEAADSYSYVGPFVGQGVPATNVVGVLLGAIAIVAVFVTFRLARSA